MFCDNSGKLCKFVPSLVPTLSKSIEMSQSNPTTATILETWRTNKKGKHAVKLRVTYQRKKKRYSTGIYLTSEEYDKVFSKRPRGEYKQINLKLKTIEQKAQDIINELPLFTFPAFEKLFLGEAGNSNSIFHAYEETIRRLNNEGRAGTASNYKCSYNSLKKFTKGKDKRFNEVTPDWLNKYERWMLKNKKSITTVGIYLRPLRALFNEAKEEGKVNPKLYPFGRRKYVIPQGENVKKALPLADIKKIFHYQTNEPHKRKAQLYWIFSYLCNGINIADIARLQRKNIKGDNIEFIRAKTRQTSKKKLKPITAYLTTKVENIIEELGNDSKHPESYVFPVLTPGMTPQQQLRAVQNLTRLINQHMDKIRKELKIKQKVTTYTARHSFSTILKNSGANVAMIGEMLGHKDTQTTQNYLDSFEDKQKKAFLKRLTDFDNENEGTLPGTLKVAE